MWFSELTICIAIINSFYRNARTNQNTESPNERIKISLKFVINEWKRVSIRSARIICIASYISISDHHQVKVKKYIWASQALIYTIHCTADWMSIFISSTAYPGTHFNWIWNIQMAPHQFVKEQNRTTENRWKSTTMKQRWKVLGAFRLLVNNRSTL